MAVAGAGLVGAASGLAGCITAARSGSASESVEFDKGMIPSEAAAVAADEQTIRGESAALGDGEAWTFVTLDASDEPVALGVAFTPDALSGLPAGDGDPQTHDGTHLHLSLPEENPTNFQWVGLDWNPDGHPPEGIYTVEHFDFHFYLMDEASVEQIPFGVAAYDIPDEQRPTGYVTADELGVPRIIEPGMGEHLIDPSSPELSGEPFTHTNIYGVYDPSIDPSSPDGFLDPATGEVYPPDTCEANLPEGAVPLFGKGSTGELTFVEPMITKAFFEGLSEEVRTSIGTPEVFPEAGDYPTEYVIDCPGDEDTYTVTMESFESFEGA